jgi:hypothetical protein
LNKILNPSIHCLHDPPSTPALAVDATCDTSCDDPGIEHIKVMPDHLHTTREDICHATPSLHVAHDQGVAMQDAHVFGRLERLPTIRWAVNAGTMIENTSLSGTNTAPHIAVHYHVDAQQTTYTPLSRTWRAWSPYKQWLDTQYRYSGAVPSRADGPANNPKPDRVTGIESGYQGQWQATDLSLDSCLLDDQVEGRVRGSKVQLNVPQDQWDPTRTEVRSSVSGSWAGVTGLEYQLTWCLLQTSWISLAQTFMNIRSDNPQHVLLAPRIITAVTTARQFDNVIGLSISSYGCIRMNGRPTERAALIPRHRPHQRLTHALAMGRDHAKAYITPQNLGQSNAAEYTPAHQADSPYYISIRQEH